MKYELYEALLKEIRLHRQRMEEAREHIDDFSKDIVYIDQYIYRFSKYQDSVGKKLFRLFLELIEESEPQMSMIDILNKLEKFGILDKEQWQEIRELRNEIAHNYDEDEETTQKIVAAIDIYLPYINQVVNNIENYLQDRGIEADTKRA